jgi:hypothetical protein
MFRNNNGAPEDIGTQLSSSDLTASDVLEGRPILSIEQSLLAKPFGDGLLRKSRPLEVISQAFGQGRLTAANLDRPLERCNVRFLHEHPKYTTVVVPVNNPGRVTGPPNGCTLLVMPATKRKTASESAIKPLRIRQAAIGPDGRTFGDRLRACMTQRARQLGRATKDYTQFDLINEATRAVGRNPDREEEWVISQQGLSLILNNKVSESHAAIAFAMSLGVEPAWLQYGIGPPSFADRILNSSK